MPKQISDTAYSRLAKASSINYDALRNADPDKFAPNRTARSAEEIVSLLQIMIDNLKCESAAQHKRFVAEMWLSVASIVVASVAAFASAYALYLTLTSV